MKIIVWNSQGSKWDEAYSNLTAHILHPAPDGQQQEDVILLLVEAGWAPWVASGNVTVNDCYPYSTELTWFKQHIAGRSAFCDAIEERRNHSAYWVPWVKNFEALKTNSRCSMGAAIFRKSFLFDTKSFPFENFTRPVIVIEALKSNSTGSGSNVCFAVILVHMVSGKPYEAGLQLTRLRDALVNKYLSPLTPFLIVGDINVDLPKNMARLDKQSPQWSILHIGQATHAGGKQLDWGILYDPTFQLRKATVDCLARYHTITNASDHSALMYSLPL